MEEELDSNFKTVGNIRTEKPVIMNVEDCNVYYGDVHALKNVNMEIGKSEVLALIGPSGCGKSTLLNTIAGLEKSDSGEILINGISIKENTNIDKLRNKSIGFVFQFHNLISELTLEENVSLPKMIAKEQWDKDELIELFEYFDLKDRMNSFPNDLSGGEKQRVAVMRAVINNPSIIIADEPTGNLDKENALKMMSLFQKLNTEKKLTIIIATHDEDVFNIGLKKYQLVDGCLKLVH